MIGRRCAIVERLELRNLLAADAFEFLSQDFQDNAVFDSASPIPAEIASFSPVDLHNTLGDMVMIEDAALGGESSELQCLSANIWHGGFPINDVGFGRLSIRNAPPRAYSTLLLRASRRRRLARR